MSHISYFGPRLPVSRSPHQSRRKWMSSSGALWVVLVQLLLRRHAQLSYPSLIDIDNQFLSFPATPTVAASHIASHDIFHTRSLFTICQKPPGPAKHSGARSLHKRIVICHFAWMPHLPGLLRCGSILACKVSLLSPNRLLQSTAAGQGHYLLSLSILYNVFKG